jgi:hypothetical protein
VEGADVVGFQEHFGEAGLAELEDAAVAEGKVAGVAVDGVRYPFDRVTVFDDVGVAGTRGAGAFAAVGGEVAVAGHHFLLGLFPAEGGDAIDVAGAGVEADEVADGVVSVSFQFVPGIREHFHFKGVAGADEDFWGVQVATFCEEGPEVISVVGEAGAVGGGAAVGDEAVLFLFNAPGEVVAFVVVDPEDDAEGELFEVADAFDAFATSEGIAEDGEEESGEDSDDGDDDEEFDEGEGGFSRCGCVFHIVLRF